MIIDCHTHLNRYADSQPPTLAGRYAALLEQMDANGIGYALVLSSYTVNDDRPGPDELLDALSADPRLGVVAGVSVPHMGGDQVSYLRGLLAADRIVALKLYPGYQPFRLTDRVVYPVYELAAEFTVPVMVHTGDTFNPAARVRYTHPLEMDDVAVEFPDTTFVMCHLGNPWFVDAMEVVYKNENVVADVSGLTLGEFQPRYERFAIGKINDAIAYINDPRKLMFGTDWPISDIASYLRFVGKLDMTEEERVGLMSDNAIRVFGLEHLRAGGGA